MNVILRSNSQQRLSQLSSTLTVVMNNLDYATIRVVDSMRLRIYV